MKPNLEQLDLQILSAINRERQAELARHAQADYALRGPTRNRPGANALRRVVIALCVIMPIVLWVARAASAAAGGGGGSGFVHLMM